MQRRVVVIGTGGTIAGTAARPQDQVDYRAGVLPVETLLAGVPALQGLPLTAETLASIDSCDMDHATWQALAQRAAALLADDDVAGVVVTHGTDTLEETAYFLHRTVSCRGKPLVLTAAMRPASALSADGPQNLFDAVTLAFEAEAAGVLVALGGRVHGGADVRKVHGWRVDAFDSGDAGVVAVIEDGRLRRFRDWPGNGREGGGDAATLLDTPAADWPVVEIASSHAGARGAAIDALVAAGARGIVIAGSGNGSVHRDLLAAAQRAVSAGVVVWRASRCLLGGVVAVPSAALPSAGALTPAQARVALLLELALT